MYTPCGFAKYTYGLAVTIERQSVQPTFETGARSMSLLGGGVAPMIRSIAPVEKIKSALFRAAKPLIWLSVSIQELAVSQLAFTSGTGLKKIRLSGLGAAPTSRAL